MLFTIKNAKKRFVSVYSVKTYARQIVLLGKKHATERILDKYLKENYELSLEYACLQIIKNIKCFINDNDDMIIILLDKNLDKIANIINSGTGPIKGSNILRIAFQQMKGDI